MPKLKVLALAALAVTLSACGQSAEAARTPNGSDPTEDQSDSDKKSEGKVVVIKAMTDEQGVNRFEPATVTVEEGDILRLTLVTGVHNLRFPSEANLSDAKLPPPSQYLQLPGQTEDLVIHMAPGKYVFQCDPHVALGMKGTLIVKD